MLILVSFFAGLIARLLWPEAITGGLGAALAVGALGALLGHLAVVPFGLSGVTGLNLPSLFVAIGGSLVVLKACYALRRRWQRNVLAY